MTAGPKSALQGSEPHRQAAVGSPSGNNTSHVPCKFYRQGACTAGRSCQFSHIIETENSVCKYFQKGNCKFGTKCALAHILPDGRRVPSRSPHYPIGNTIPVSLQLGNRIIPSSTVRPGTSALHNGLVQASVSKIQKFGHSPQPSRDEFQSGGPSFPVPIPMHQPPNFSPKSPMLKAFSPLDAQLPPSLDSNGLSYFARHGPVAASVPSKFGRSLSSLSHKHTLFEQDLPSGRAPGSSRNSSAFVHDKHRPSVLSRSAGFSSSFPVHSWTANEEVIDDDIEFALEEDFVPSSLHEDVFSLQERQRRLSRHEQRESIERERETRASLHAPPVDLSSSAGSVTRGTPPSSSRFGAFFSSRYSFSAKDDLHPIGHISSPLRRTVNLVPEQRFLDFTQNDSLLETSQAKSDLSEASKEHKHPHEKDKPPIQKDPDDDTTFFMDDPDETLTPEMQQVLIQ